MAQPPSLLPELVRRRLEPLMLVARAVRAGAVKGDRRSIKRGTSIEFADYRNYAAGDDLRQLDWNIYARLERPYIKLLEDEEDLAVHILLDASASMDFPAAGLPDQHKLLFAKRIAAGLAYLALTSGDRLTVAALRAGAPRQFGPARGRAQSLRMLHFLGQVGTDGMVNLDAALAEFAQRARPGLTLLISDMFSLDGQYRDGLNALLSRGHEVAIVHVLAREELEPQVTGDLSLVDVETTLQQEVTLDGAMLAVYQRRLQSWRDELRADCRRRGAHYFPLVTDAAWESLILRDMRRAGLVK
ncbi:MAG: DUF58 domain-containing protein [Chloroflexi bacterium]|nr:DUF58 domain-containing protein [Chloroflexota bacterium]MCY3582998.1 DUF58 domain-containing protein [Chloroflexota bacterium]MCY3716902.1 DUF58 domain-containing protein [Chloroflexota bacterium]MDE2650116.1 DUF58 domain-containing protein [Chloroflexota bacterium]MXV92987.1 DUF58 domain-containing protein [Chloroflexota bacterium]